MSSPLFIVNVCWIALTRSFQVWKQHFTLNIWRANISGLQIGTIFFLQCKKLIFAILIHSGWWIMFIWNIRKEKIIKKNLSYIGLGLTWYPWFAKESAWYPILGDLPRSPSTTTPTRIFSEIILFINTLKMRTNPQKGSEKCSKKGKDENNQILALMPRSQSPIRGGIGLFLQKDSTRSNMRKKLFLAK